MKVLGTNIGGSSGGGGGGAAPMPASMPVTVGTSNVDVKLAFLRKVYTLLTINFAITVGISVLFTVLDPIRSFLRGSGGTILLVVGFIVSIGCLIALSCIRMAFPMNIIVMYIFVLAESVVVGVIVSKYFDNGYGSIVLQAFIATAVVFLTITAYIAVTKKDFNFLYGFLAAGTIILLVLLIFNFVLSALFVRSGTRRVISFVISVFGALLMVGYLLYDTSKVITRYGPDQWLESVIALYVDVINLFLFFLNIFSFINN